MTGFYKHYMVVAVFLLFLGTLISCSEKTLKIQICDTKDVNCFEEPSVPLGQGEVATFVTQDTKGVPKQIGVAFNVNALASLPTSTSDGSWDIINSKDEVVWFCCGHEISLNFPEDVSIPFKHFVLNWNPEGHPPPDVYTVPHFDFHFYTIGNEERKAISAPTAEDACPGILDPGNNPVFVPLDCSTFFEAIMSLPEDQQAPGYMTVGAVEPGMGNHQINLSSPEFNGKAFTETWIYGTYGGNITFWEPMITKTTIEQVKQGEKSCTDFPTPKAAPEGGYYPSTYCISRDGNLYKITLENFKLLPESGSS